MANLLARLARRRAWVMATTVLVSAVAVVVGGSAAGRFSTGSGDYLDPSSSVARAYASVREATGVDPQQGFVLLVDLEQPLRPGAPPPARVRAAESLLRRLPAVRDVSDYRTGGPAFLSRDRTSTIVSAELGAVANPQKLTDRLEGEIRDAPLLRGRVLVGGPTAANGQATTAATHDLGVSESIGIPILLVLCVFVFRGLVATLLPLLGGVVTVLLALLGLAAVEPFTSVSVYAVNLVVALGLGLCVDFSLLMLSRFREEYAEHVDAVAAVTTTLATAGRTITFSALTVGAALGALLAFPMRFISSLGLAGMLTAASALAYGLLVLPALLLTFAPRLVGGHRQRAVAAEERSQRRWYRLSSAVIRRPFVPIAAAALALLALGSPVRHISFSGFDASTLPPHLEAARTYERLGQEFTSASSEPIHLVVHAPANAAAPMQRLAHEVTADHGVRSAGRPRYRGGGIWILDAIPAAPPLSSAAQATVKRLDRLAAPLRPVATGATANFISESDSYGSHLPLALAIVAATTLLLLWALTGSVTLPLTAALLNAATLLAAFGANVWIFEQGHLGSLLGAHNPGPLDESAPILLGALAFGLSTDYGVFLFARIGEERRRGREHVEAIAHGVARTGRVVTSAALLFCVAIGALAISDSRPLKQLGFGTALAVVVDATIVRAVLVPSLMRLIGRWSWWAPARLRRLHTRIRFAER